MEILSIILVSVGLVWGIQPQPDPYAKKEELTILLSPMGSEVEVRASMGNVANNPGNIEPEHIDEVLKPKPSQVQSKTTTPVVNPVTERSITIDLSQRLFCANHEDCYFHRNTLNLSHLDLTGEDVMKFLHSLNSTVLLSVACLDLSHTKVSDLPARVWPLELEYSLRELRLDYIWLNLAYPSRSTRFELSRLRSLKKLSLSHSSLGTTLGSLDFPPIESLNLSGSRLEELPASLTTITTLQHLDFSHNHLGVLFKSPLSSLTGLKTLNLSHNDLVQIWDDPLEKLYSLETLHLDHNALSEPPKLYQFHGSYQPRMEVYMSENAFKCGCSFKNFLDDVRLVFIDKLNVTCVDDNGVEWSVDTAPANQCSPHWEVVRQKWSGAKEWVQENRPDWSTFYRSLGWLLFGITLGLVYTLRRAKKTSPPTSQVPYNILDDTAS